MSYKSKLGFIGAGNMALAIASALTRSGLYDSADLIGSDISSQRRDLFAKKLQAVAIDDNQQVIRESQTVILAIKPQQAQAVLKPLAGTVSSEQLIISIMAGVTAGTIEGMLTGEVTTVRVMPNLALSVGEGMTAICPWQKKRCRAPVMLQINRVARHQHWKNDTYTIKVSY